MDALDKRWLVDLIRAQIDEEMATLVAAAKATQEAATHEEARPENDKDTRALEQSYLARGQAARVEDLQELATRLKFLELPAYGEDDPIGPAALVGVEVDDEESMFFLVPVGGGRKLALPDREVTVVTTTSPVGRALLGKEVGDEFDLTIGPRKRRYVILSVA